MNVTNNPNEGDFPEPPDKNSTQTHSWVSVRPSEENQLKTELCANIFLLL